MRRSVFRCLLVTWLVVCASTATAYGQSVPASHLGGTTFDEPLPTRFTSGETYWVSGIAGVGISALTFEFGSERGVLEHRVLVVKGRFEHPLVFKHADAGEHAFRVTLFRTGQPPFSTEPFTGIEIIEGEGEIERPWEYYDGFIDNAYFRPNVIHAEASEFPPLFVTTSGRVETVLVFVPDGHGGSVERELSDDGMAGDLEAGDGVFTMTGAEYHPPDVELGPFGSITIGVVFEDETGTVFNFSAECGIVDGIIAPVQKLSDTAYLADHSVNLVDDGTLFVLSQPFVDFGAIGRRFYEYFSDDYDFLTFRSSLDLSNGANGLSVHVHNDVTGIGIASFDDSEVYGSAGRLQSITFINFRLLGPLVHEIAHTWANFLNLFGGRFWGGHWGFSDVQGVLGGHATTIQDLGNGQYVIPRNSSISTTGGRYSLLELYLMGLVPAEEVPPHQVLVNPSILGLVEGQEDLIVVAADQLATVTIEDVIDSHGARLPTHEEAQKSFRMGTVVISDRPLSPLELAYHDRQAEWFGSDRDHEHSFAAATGYRATMDTRMERPITAVLDDEVAMASTDGLPGRPDLEQNYPNPFNSSTTFRFALNSRATPSLEIYAANGQQVRTILLGHREVGRYTIQWDGTDDDGHPLATGVYIARLQVGDAAVTRKLTLIR